MHKLEGHLQKFEKGKKSNVWLQWKIEFSMALGGGSQVIKEESIQY